MEIARSSSGQSRNGGLEGLGLKVLTDNVIVKFLKLLPNIKQKD